MIFSSRNYAIGMAHHQIAGGTRTLLLLCGGYVAIASAVMGLTLYNVPAPQLPMAMRAIATFFLIIEAFMLVLFGSMRVAGCIRTDVTTTMLESHRQMPVSAWRAVLGYMFGSTTHLLALVFLNVIFLAVMTSIAHVDLADFITAQVVLGVFALWIWSFAAMVTLMFRQAMPLMIIGFVLGSIVAMFLRTLLILPGISLLAAPFLGETIFNLSRGLVNVRSSYAISLPAQAAFGAIFFMGACRKYRGTYLTTLNVPLGLALVSVWSALTAIGIRIWPSLIDPVRRGFVEIDPRTQVVAGLAVAAMLMIVPVHALSAWDARHPVTKSVRVLTLAAAVATAMALCLGGSHSVWLLTVTAIVLAAHACTIFECLRVLRGMAAVTVVVTMVILIFAVWLLPLLVELIRWKYLQNYDPEARNDLTVLSTLSPLGLLIAIWKERDGVLLPSPWAGLVWHWMVAGGLWLLAERRTKVLAREESTGAGAQPA